MIIINGWQQGAVLIKYRDFSQHVGGNGMNGFGFARVLLLFFLFLESGVYSYIWSFLNQWYIIQAR